MNTLFPSAWFDLLPANTQEQIVNIESKLSAIENTGTVVYPPVKDRYAALNIVSPSQCKVVLIGQDPYHNEGEAMGLSFSVRKGIKIPPSLRNIYKELASDIGCEIPKAGDLSYWAEQGVLLLNAALTVEAGNANCHGKKASKNGPDWRPISAGFVSAISESLSGLIFVLWGNDAKALKPFIKDNGHTIIESSHPSPIGGSCYKGFFGSKSFSRVNLALKNMGKSEIDWDIAAQETRKDEANNDK